MSEEKASANLLAQYPENGAAPVLRTRRSVGGGAVVICMSLLLCLGVVAMATYCTIRSIRNESRVRTLEFEIKRLQHQMASLQQSGMAYNVNEDSFDQGDEYTLDTGGRDVYSDGVYGDDDEFPDEDDNSGDDSDEMVVDENDFLFDDKQVRYGVTSSRNKRSASRKGKKNGNKKRKMKRQKGGGKEKLEKYIKNKIKEASGLAAIHLDGALTHNSDVMARLRSSVKEFQEYPELDGRLYQQGFVTNRETMAFWQPASWANNDKSNNVYSFNKTEGSVTVKQDGIYFIYAQVHFHDTAAWLGYGIQKHDHHNNNNNSTILFSCYTSIDPLPDELPASSAANRRSYARYESCNVNGLTSLVSGDVISLRLRNRHFRIEASRQMTFWGMFRVNLGEGLTI